jgi:hypothetical protein
VDADGRRHRTHTVDVAVEILDHTFHCCQ